MQRILLFLFFSFLLFSCSKEESPVETIPDTTVVQPVDSTPINQTAYYTGSMDSLPKFVRICYIEFDSIARISRFRSGAGHDYSDDFEFCRSMKHYFEPKNFFIPNVIINIYCPFEAVVTRLEQEWAGTQIHIESTQYPAFSARLFHVNLNPNIAVGDTLREGLLIGSHIGNMTGSDIAIAVLTPNDGPKDSTISQSGIRYVSYFSIMTDSLFNKFEQHGLTSDSLIIPASTRDLYPLDCNNGAFTNAGTLNNWVSMH